MRCPAPIDQKDMSGHQIGRVGCEIDDRPNHILGFSHTTQGDVPQDIITKILYWRSKRPFEEALHSLTGKRC